MGGLRKEGGREGRGGGDKGGGGREEGGKERKGWEQGRKGVKEGGVYEKKKWKEGYSKGGGEKVKRTFETTHARCQPYLTERRKARSKIYIYIYIYCSFILRSV